MNTEPLLTQATVLVKGGVPALQRADPSTQIDARWVPGQKLSAVVLATLANGRFQVSVDHQTLEMNLPKNTQPGEQLHLVFAGSEPRLTFILQPNPLPAPQGVATELSQAAQFLEQLQQEAPGETTGLQQTAPVLPAPPDSPAPLANALQSTVSQSGLFYESHQAEWVQGQRTLASLQQEPQAQLPLAVTNAASPDPALPAAPAATAPADPSAAPAPVAPGSAALPAAPAHLAHPAALVPQQIQTLDSNSFQWRGPVWPGQEMDWQIAPYPDGSGPETMQWQTRMDLDMPGLGPVSAWLILSPAGLQVRLSAANDGTAPLLNQAAPRLEQGLAAAGLNLLQMTVTRDEKA